MDSELYTYQQPLEGHSGSHVERDGAPLLMLSSYDYLGLIGHPDIETAARDAISTYGTGTGGVRLLTGSSGIHRKLEMRLAAFFGSSAAMSFGSGYTANIGVIAALLGPRDVAIVDEHIHRSVYDACTLSGCSIVTCRHNDPADLERALKEETDCARRLVIVEGIYSMDGDVCPLPEIVELKHRYGAQLMIDEAHSLGVLGKNGHGVTEHFDVPVGDVDLITGSLSKAVPANGGFLIARPSVVYYLQHAASPYIFSGALAPSSAAAAATALDVIENEPERRISLWRNGEMLHTGLRAMGADTGLSTTPLLPLITGSDEATWVMARALLNEGVVVSPVVYPAVARGRARLRLCATAGHSAKGIEDALQAIAKTLPDAAQAVDDG